MSDITKQILQLVSLSFSGFPLNIPNTPWINVCDCHGFFFYANERGNAVLVGHNRVRLGHRSNVENHFIQCLCAGTLNDIMITTITRLRVRSDLFTR